MSVTKVDRKGAPAPVVAPTRDPALSDARPVRRRAHRPDQPSVRLRRSVDPRAERPADYFRSANRMIRAPTAKRATTTIATVPATIRTSGTIVTSSCDAAAIQVPSRTRADRLRRPTYNHTPTATAAASTTSHHES